MRRAIGETVEVEMVVGAQAVFLDRGRRRVDVVDEGISARRFSMSSNTIDTPIRPPLPCAAGPAASNATALESMPPETCAAERPRNRSRTAAARRSRYSAATSPIACEAGRSTCCAQSQNGVIATPDPPASTVSRLPAPSRGTP